MIHWNWYALTRCQRACQASPPQMNSAASRNVVCDWTDAPSAPDFWSFTVNTSGDTGALFDDPGAGTGDRKLMFVEKVSGSPKACTPNPIASMSTWSVPFWTKLESTSSMPGTDFGFWSTSISDPKVIEISWSVSGTLVVHVTYSMTGTWVKPIWRIDSARSLLGAWPRPIRRPCVLVRSTISIAVLPLTRRHKQTLGRWFSLVHCCGTAKNVCG